MIRQMQRFSVLAALLAAIGQTPVDAIVVTHTHRDHSPLARALQATTGAPIVGADVHRFAREQRPGDAPVDVAADTDHTPQTVLAHKDTVGVEGFTLTGTGGLGHSIHVDGSLTVRDCVIMGVFARVAGDTTLAGRALRAIREGRWKCRRQYGAAHQSSG